MDYQKTGTLIASLRKEKGLTQKELADKLGITDRAVSKWERGLGCPDVSLLDDLSRILDVSILEILKGRRIDKADIINNESIIESMNYSKENFKFKLKRYFNLTCIFIIIIISGVLIISNLKSIYYLNKTYRYNYIDDNGFNYQLLTEINDSIEMIKKDQGAYTDAEYEKILSFINKLENNLKEQNNLYYLKKNNYKYSEIITFYNTHQEFYYLESPYGHIQEIYEIVHNYNPNVVKNITLYYAYTTSVMNNSYNIFEELKKPYYNGEKINSEIVASIKSFIGTEIRKDNMLLKDIVEVGGINE